MGGGTRVCVMSRRALLAPDCGQGVGLGHLERMLALADALRPDTAASLILPSGDVTLRRRVEDRGHAVVEAPGTTASRVATVADSRPPMDVIVLDGYVFNVALQSRLRDAAPLVVVDDLGLPAACDLAVNPSPGGEGLRPSGAHRFLGGAAYALLRESFVDARDSVLLRGRAGRTVLVSTGATDIDGIAERVSEELLERDDTVEIVRVIGPDAPPDAAAHQRRLRLLVSPQSLAEALTAVTVYVGAAGTTAVQAACVGIPAVVNAMVPNQRAQAGALAAAGCAIVVEPDDLTTACLQLLDDPDRCEQMGAHGRTLVDGRGAERVAAALRDCLRRGAP